jgi:hypothetical protein
MIRLNNHLFYKIHLYTFEPMKYPIAILTLFLLGCNPPQYPQRMTQDSIQNETLKSYSFLKCMYDDAYFPSFLVDKVKVVLISLCIEIETTQPKDLDVLYQLTHAATEKINSLEDEFYENNSEIETAARECIAENFEYVSKSYGFSAEVEELIAPRNW